MALNTKELSLGTVLEDRYEIVKRIGSSYCGAVYQAKDKLNYDNLVALRSLDESSFTPSGLEHQIDYLLENGLNLLEAHHSNVASVYDYELFADRKYIINECLLGYTLNDLVEEDAEDPLDVKVKYKLFRDICNSISYLYENNIKHYRLTPSNIFLVKKGREYTPKIVGHEICLLTDKDVEERSKTHKIYYPDNREEGHVIYALGRMLYEIFSGDQTDGINGDLIPTESTKASDVSIYDIVMKCTEANVSDPYNSISDIIRDLDSVFPDLFDVSDKKSDSNVNICPHCFFANQTKSKICVQCNSDLNHTCPECSNNYPVADDMCSRCKTNPSLFYKFIATIQKMKKGFLAKDPDAVYEAHKVLPEEVNFLGDKGKKLKSSAYNLKYITDENVSKATQLKETVFLFLEASDYASAMECVDAFREFVLTDEFINKQATDLIVKIEEQAFNEAQEKAAPFVESKDYLSAVGVYQEYLREHPFGSYSHKASEIVKEELLESYNGLELLNLYADIIDLADDKKFAEAHNKGERLLKVVAKLIDKDAPIDEKKITGNDIKVKTTKLLNEMHGLEVKEKNKQRWLVILGLTFFLVTFCTGIGFFAFVRVQARNSYEKYMSQADISRSNDDFEGAGTSYQAALSVVGYSSDKQASYGLRWSAALLSYNEMMRNLRAYLELIRSKIKSDEEFLVSKYFKLANKELAQLNTKSIQLYLTEVERATIANIKNNIYKEKRDYWRERVERRPWVLPMAGIEFVMIKETAGEIGSPPDEEGRKEDETQRDVVFESPVWVGKFEVTQEQYQKVMKHNPSSFKSLRLNRPVEMVSWEKATEFCRRITEHERAIAQLTADLEYRLPTDDEWEFLCRAGTTTVYNTGDSITSKQANFSDGTRPEIVGTSKVGSFKPNAWGLYDMHGNVAEWCRSNYNEQENANTGLVEKCIRGGGWFDTKHELRSAHRDGSNRVNKFDNVGFRIVLAKKSK